MGRPPWSRETRFISSMGRAGLVPISCTSRGEASTVSIRSSASANLFTTAGTGTGGNTVTVASPGSQSSTLGTAISPLQLQASESAAGQALTYSATGLPAGLAIDANTGRITE